MDHSLEINEPEMGLGKISIVIPCYNQGNLLRETLQSVEMVRNPNLIEVIIVDDGSNDIETSRFFDEFKDSRYAIIRQPNRGLAAARNEGIRLAKGGFILPLDSDNLLSEAYLTKGINLFKQDPRLQVVYSNLEYFGEKSGRIKVPDFRLPLLAEGNFIDACALFRKSLWEEIGGYDEQMPWQGWEDWDFWLRAAMKGATFGHLDEVGFHYRCRTGSMLSTTNLHRDELLDYIFSKKELWLAAVLRKVVLENAGLREKCAVLEKTPTSRLIGFAKSFFRQGPA